MRGRTKEKRKKKKITLLDEKTDDEKTDDEQVDPQLLQMCQIKMKYHYLPPIQVKLVREVNLPASGLCQLYQYKGIIQVAGLFQILTILTSMLILT